MEERGRRAAGNFDAAVGRPAAQFGSRRPCATGTSRTPAVQLPLVTSPGQPTSPSSDTNRSTTRRGNSGMSTSPSTRATISGPSCGWPYAATSLKASRMPPIGSRTLRLRATSAGTATSVSRTDDRHVRVVVSGTVGYARRRTRLGTVALASAVDRNRYLVARLQRRDPLIDTELGWETIVATRMMLRGSGAEA